MSQPEQSGVRRGCKPSAITNMADAAARVRVGGVRGGGLVVMYELIYKRRSERLFVLQRWT